MKDVGFNKLNEDGDDYETIKGSDGKPLSSAVFLNGAGQPLAVGDDPVDLAPFDIYEAKPFRKLGLPESFYWPERRSLRKLNAKCAKSFAKCSGIKARRIIRSGGDMWCEIVTILSEKPIPLSPRTHPARFLFTQERQGARQTRPRA